MAYLFFYNKQGHRGLKQDATETLRARMAEVFSEWISHSAHFGIILLPLVEVVPRAPSTWPRGRPPKAHPVKDGMGNSLPSSPNRGGVDSDG